jgi:ribulose-phosphate 3-epimerase
VIKGLRKSCGILFDVHLMISEPLRSIDDFVDAGADIITFHVESESDIDATIAKILSHGIKAGMVVKPNTPVERVFPYLDRLSMALVMTVEPGFGGQKFMADMLPKIRALRAEIQRRGLDVEVEVDGGIDETTAPLVAEAGANVLVAGSALFSQPDYAVAVKRLREATGS